MKTKIVLISASVDWNDGKFFTTSMSAEWVPFSADLPAELDPKDILKTLFYEIVDLHSEWANFIPISNEIIEKKLNLIYGVIIPIDSKWKAPFIIDAGFIPETHIFKKHLVETIGKIT